MATTSYGSITIVDITDVGEFSVYPQANKAQTQIYNPDESNATAYSPNWAENNNPLVITPVAFYAGVNKTAASRYTWKKYVNGVETQFTTNEVVANTSRHESLTINANVLTVNSPIVTYEVTAYFSPPDFGTNELEAVGRIDFSLISRGSSAKTVKITGDNIFAYDATGNLKQSGASPILLTATYSNVTTVGWKYKSGTSWLSYPTTGPGGEQNITTGSPSTLKVFENQQVSGASIFTGDSLTVKFEAVDISGNEVSDIFTITKLRDGGMIASATLTNDDQMIPADKDGNPTTGAFGEATTTKITIYDKNGNVDTNNWDITISKTTGLTYQKSKNGTDWFAEGITGTDYTYVKVTGMTASVDTGNITFSCVNKTDNSQRIEKQFSLVKVKAGKDGEDPVVYDMIADVVAVNKNEAGAYSPTQVVFTAKQTTGNTTVDWANGFIRVFADNSVVSNNNTTARSSVTYTFAGTNVQVFKAVLYEDNSFTTQLASQSVTVTKDGTKGADGKEGLGAINVVIDNEAESIPCLTNNKLASDYTITIHFTGYQGTTTRPTSITVPNISGFTVPSGQSISKSVSGNTITYVIPAGSTLATKGSAQLNFQVTGQHYDMTTGSPTYGQLVNDTTATEISKLFTWSRSSAAQEAVMVLIETPQGTVWENSQGQLTAVANVLDGNTPIADGDATYTWQQYGGANPGADGYGSLKTGASASGKTLTVGANAVDGFGSFRVIVTYPSGGTNTYRSYVSFIDKFDPIQVSVHSTIGTQIKNHQGFGAMYVRVTRDGQEIDEIPLNVEAVTSTSEADSNATYCIVVTKPTSTTSTDDTVAARGNAVLYKKTGTSWGPATINCTYTWTYRGSDDNVLDSSKRKPATTGKCVYVDSSLINSKITADVRVEVN